MAVAHDDLVHKESKELIPRLVPASFVAVVATLIAADIAAAAVAFLFTAKVGTTFLLEGAETTETVEDNDNQDKGSHSELGLEVVLPT